jgi:hypothetical protein
MAALLLGDPAALWSDKCAGSMRALGVMPQTLWLELHLHYFQNFPKAKLSLP